MSQTLLSKRTLLAVSLLAFSLAGCEKAPTPDPTGTLIGTVKSGGEICGDCRISLFNSKTFLSRGGRVDESGNYEVKNIPFGDYDIYMYQTPTNAVVEVFDERIPKKYRNKKSSGLKASLTSSEPVTLNIEME